MQYPRMKDLPEAEREEFAKWLFGRTRPVNDETEPLEQWDWYYPWDYERWKPIYKPCPSRQDQAVSQQQSL